ncbi:MAG: DUF885 domain-containing protein [Anaerolineales bacterium]|nr:DUF885 domain-containing protein [Anaerolineales bacterium]
MLKKSLFILILFGLLAGCSSQLVGAPAPNSEEVPGENYNQSSQDSEEQISVAGELTAHLAGLSIGDFYQQAFYLILERDPELVLELGLKGIGPSEPVLTDVSPQALAVDDQINRELLNLLREYDFASLTPEDQISYQVFEWYLEDAIQLYQDAKFKYLVSPMSVRSAPQLYLIFFTDSHPFNSTQDAEGYVARIHLLDEKIDQLIAQIEVQEDAGVIPPRIVLEYGRSDLKQWLGRSALASPLKYAFSQKAPSVLDDNTYSKLEEELIQALEEEVFPAFDRLDEKLAALQSQAPDVLGISAYDGGAEYYQRQLRHFTTTEMTAEEIHARGLAEVERIQKEMRERFVALGYPENESIEQLYQRLADDSGYLTGDAITTEYERILAEADQLVPSYFETRPAGALEVVGGNAGAFYSPGSMDGSRPGKFYALITAPEAVYKMRSLAYHEGIPGHHYQITLAAMADLPLFRNLMNFTGFVEGWALYAEYLAYDLGWYDDDPYGDLGRLQYEALRAVRMVVDTGIHMMGWDFSQSVDYMVENSGFSRGFSENQIMRYIAYPAQSTAYLVGKIEIMAMREKAEESLGNDFVLSEFHSVILNNGSMPLETLEAAIEDWIRAKLAG